MWRNGIAFLIGQCCVHLLPALPSYWPWAAVLGVAAGAALFLRTYAVLAILLGFGWAWSFAHLRLADDLPAELEGRDLIVIGRIASMLDVRELDPQFEFDVEHASDERVPARLRLGWYESDEQPRPGECWRFVVRLKRRSGFANPGGFDYEAHLFRIGIGATGYVRAGDFNRRLDGPGAKYVVLRTRAWIAQRMTLAAGQSPLLGVMQGLAVGDTQAMTPEQWRVFAATGTAHLMAISGLHISMVAALAACAGGAIVRRRAAQARRITAIHGQALAGSAAALGYSLLAGMSVPTQRTLVMLCIFFVARWRRRELGIANAFGIALLGVLVLDPLAPLSIGAWLSFGAVAMILLATTGRLVRDRALASFVRVQWAVTLGLLPFALVAFGGQSLVSPLANALAVPVFTLIAVPLVLFGAALACVSSSAGSVVLGVAGKLLGLLWPLLEWLAEQSWAMWFVPTLPPAYVAMLALAVLLLIAPSIWPMRLVAVLCCLPIALHRPAAPQPGDYTVSVLDVGQGLAVVIGTRAHTLVYDAGPAFRTGRDTGELVVVPYLRARGVRAVDRLVISHGDLDHQGGMRSILAALPVASLLVGPSVNGLPHATPRCTAGQRWRWDDIEFEILHPSVGVGESASDNNTSCVLRVSGLGGTTLLTGDIEADAERELLGKGPQPADVVIVAHHGSRSSSTQAFVESTSPQLALVSAGYRNRWGFPRPEVARRWRAAGATVIDTVAAGAIEVAVTRRSGIDVHEYRRERRKYWSAR
jgi:competence protein ComEC